MSEDSIQELRRIVEFENQLFGLKSSLELIVVCFMGEVLSYRKSAQFEADDNGKAKSALARESYLASD